ncbi:DJ-1/PfpI family protein [Sphingosinicella rhizophila]|uniref:DJ-1/PfpI family protein n=1 Tax=Sphingosinicella rhizophila TaxID=3050082 RepID=A0ABU3QBA5_9SPHN|nr:DJ-1/PfpI family protein [Sphingosinicella sp. GR2756]MDT9600684.1 DJ-1/PfpI family protein [Sphingosinicella sp. GR2756]
MTFRCGLLLFPELTQLDLTGPYEVLPRAPGVEVLLVARTMEPVTAQWGMRILPDTDFANCPPLDLLLVPGGFGVDEAMLDQETIAFVRRTATEARYIVSVCTGALILGAAGLLRGRRAATHWAFRDLLKEFGATPSRERVVRDGNLFTGGGVTAGIDVALTILAEVFDANVAQSAQLSVEYAPCPPFGAGTPETAPGPVAEAVAARYATGVARTAERVRAAAQRLAN